jgi:DNA-binding ferritin-like protein
VDFLKGGFLKGVYIYIYSMPKYNNKTRHSNKTNKNNKTRHIRLSNSTSLYSFQKEITMTFLEMLLMIKLYHWKTYSYATHKATDELYGKLNENMDHFIEVLLGKSGERIDLIKQKSIPLIDLSSAEDLKKEIYSFKGYLASLNNNKAMKQMTNTDLLNIRDEILGDLNQFLYLLSFK